MDQEAEFDSSDIDPEMEAHLAGWARYEDLIAEESWAEVLEMVRTDDDVSMANSAVVCVLETGKSVSEVEPMMEAFTEPDMRAFLERRRDEASILRAYARSEAAAIESEGADVLDVDQWTDWLQRRVVEATDSRNVLTVLHEQGRTKRVRNRAMIRLRN